VLAYYKKSKIIRIFSISGWLAVPINPDNLSSTAFKKTDLGRAIAESVRRLLAVEVKIKVSPRLTDAGT
jgi:hypothetical protein